MISKFFEKREENGTLLAFVPQSILGPSLQVMPSNFGLG
jgi:hypothetical protein